MTSDPAAMQLTERSGGETCQNKLMFDFGGIFLIILFSWIIRLHNREMVVFIMMILVIFLSHLIETQIIFSKKSKQSFIYDFMESDNCAFYN